MISVSPSHSFFQKKWLYHSLFWINYSGFWFLISAPRPFSFFSLYISLIYLFFNSVPAYINIYGLMPRYLYKKKFLTYLGSFLLTVSIFAVGLGGILYKYFGLFELNMEMSEFFKPYILGSTFGSVLSSSFIVAGIKLVKRYWLIERQKQEAEKVALSSELKFLRSQLNPHFMFNALNNIYFLIKKDPEIAAEALATYSEILRYQLYDCNEKFISLKEEIDFLENYINISKLRKNRLKLSFQKPHTLNGEQIAPLLLVPLVENAFKHVSDEKNRQNLINIDIQLKQKNLVFHIENSTKPSEEKPDSPIKESGIGLSNVKRRLDLLYPGQYQLHHTQNDEVYTVNLSLPLS